MKNKSNKLLIEDFEYIARDSYISPLLSLAIRENFLQWKFSVQRIADDKSNSPVFAGLKWQWGKI